LYDLNVIPKVTIMLLFQFAPVLTVANPKGQNDYKAHNTQENIMKTTNAFWIILALTTSVLVAPSAHSQTERFSASLSGANEVPPINSAGMGNFEMTIQPGMITFSLNFSDLS
jgi:hypothetical protein